MALGLSPTRARVLPYASPPVARAGTLSWAFLLMSAVIIAAAATIAAPTPIAAQGLAKTDLSVVLKAMTIIPNSMSCAPMFLRKLANCVRIAFIKPPKPRSPAITLPRASAAATIESARNCDTCWSKRCIVEATVCDTCSSAAVKFQPLAVSAAV